MKSFLATIVAAILALFGGHQAATHSASQGNSPAVVIMRTPSATSYADTSVTPDLPPTTIINRPIIERVIEQASPTITEAVLDARLQSLADSIKIQSPSIVYVAPSISGPGAPLSVEAFAPSQAIDKLTNATLNNVTVNGVSGLTASDLPDLSGKYLSQSGGTLTGALINSGTASSSFAGALGIGTTNPSSQFDLEGWTVTSGAGSAPDYASGNPQFQINGTLDGTASPGHITGFQGIWQTVGGTATNVNGMRLQLDAGYTGTGIVRVADFQNYVAGSHILGIGDVKGTIGTTIESQGLSTGDNIGTYSIADGAANYNFASYNRSFQSTQNNTQLANVAVAGVANNAANAQIGGLFAIGNGNSGRWYPNDLTATDSAALIADSQDSGAPVFRGKINASDVFQISSSGGIISTSTTNATNFWQVLNSSGSPVFGIDTTNLRVGIGTTTPGSVLSVQGVANWTNATSTYYSTGGINLTSGCFAVSGSCISGTVNSGSQGQFAFYNAAGTALTATSTLFVAQSGNIGVATTTPVDNLTVTNPVTTATLGVISNGNTAGSGNVRFDLTNGDGNKFSWQFGGSGVTALKLQYNSANHDTFNNDGSLAIGQTAGPSNGSILTAAGLIQVASSTNPTSMNSLAFYGGAGADNGFISNSTTNVWNLGYGANGNLTTLATPVLTWNASGNVGIGTTSPSATFAVSGTSYFSGNFQASSTLNVISTWLTKPLEPVVTASGSNDGTVNYRYVLVVHGAGTTAASAAMVNPFAGNSTLDGTHFNIIQTVSQPGCTSVDVYRTSPVALTTGMIGSTSCGAVLNDTGLVGNSQTAPTSDTGSAGTVSNNPLVLNSSLNPTSVFGSLQVGEAQLNVPAPTGDGGYEGPLAVFTTTGSHNNAIVIQAASAINDAGMLFRHSTGTITNPVSEGSGSGWISGEVYVAGSVNQWTPATFSEFGGDTPGSITTLGSVYGRWQWGVANGNVGGYNGAGMVLGARSTYTAPLNNVALLFTNNVDFRQYRVGYTQIQNTDDTTNFERVDGTWYNGGTTYNFGPVAGGTGTLRAMNLTGSAIGIGTTTPFGELAISAQNGTNYPGNTLFNIASSTAAATTTLFIVNNAGNIGIGTSSPMSKLAIADNGGPALTLSRTGFANGLAQLSAGSTGGTLSSPGVIHLTTGSGNLLDINQAFYFDTSNRAAFGGSNVPIQNDTTLYLRGRSNQYSLKLGDSNDNINFVVQNSGNVGVGTTTPSGKFAIALNSTDAAYPGNNAFIIGSSTANATTTLFNVLNTGNAVLAGTLTQNSDQRLKTNIQPLDASASLAAIDALNPVSFDWINGIFGGGDQLGFIAQDVQKLFPQLVSTSSPTSLTPGGTLGLNYTGLISPIVSAIHALDQELSSLASTITGFAERFVSNRITANQELCVGSTCVTPAQFQAMLTAANQANASAPSNPPSNSTGGSSHSDDLPVIQINGENPATITVGATYSDLGATITGPQADMNLGIATYVNGAAMSSVVIDTTSAATDTIDYVVTDPFGNAATSTRTVIIEMPIAQ